MGQGQQSQATGMEEELDWRAPEHNRMGSRAVGPSVRLGADSGLEGAWPARVLGAGTERCRPVPPTHCSSRGRVFRIPVGTGTGSASTTS